MTNIDDIIADLKTDDPMTGVLEVIETLENAQKRIEELTAFIDREKKMMAEITHLKSALLILAHDSRNTSNVMAATQSIIQMQKEAWLAVDPTGYYRAWPMEDARAALKNASCDHEWIDPSNEKIVAGNWRLCLKCMALKEGE